jgi:hypothetical protein
LEFLSVRSISCSVNQKLLDVPVTFLVVVPQKRTVSVAHVRGFMVIRELNPSPGITIVSSDEITVEGNSNPL